MGAPRSIVIIGAGISGLTLALALAKFGVRVTVIERNAGITEFGAGLQISSNARKCLDALGLGDAVAAASFAPEGIDLYPFNAPDPLQTLMLGEKIADRFGAPYAVMHRGDLAGVLYAAAKKFANIEVLFGVERFALDERNGKTVVSFTENGHRQRTIRPFALVGADGVNSAVRRQWMGGMRPDYSGKVAWRALVSPQSLEGIVNLDRVSVLFGTRHHLVVYPLPHRQTVNLALFTQERERDLDALEKGQPSLRNTKDRRLAAILAAAGKSWTPWVLAAVEIERWHKGAVGLIGDAAHAMLPFQAQGAAMGIEDATVLAPLLATASNPEEALARYAALRQERVKRVQAVSRNNGRIFHMGFPASVARDMVIRAQGPEGHFERLDWLYGYEPEG
ncbi:FAD-dependent oxidoreductase [Pelagibacterium sediminicola]|uniref:FAD-dependent oxidoreductase n=1 Tax=Pelagibacterium sediminicola TaxID=2248761 RepID=UPI000E31E12D|nr:FAD-dependent oxidoreductase [Pelagibacterium sediminicola]